MGSRVDVETVVLGRPRWLGLAASLPCLSLHLGQLYTNGPRLHNSILKITLDEADQEIQPHIPDLRLVGLMRRRPRTLAEGVGFHLYHFVIFLS